jgi:hypothetical protein
MEHPGCSMKEALDNIETHYASKASARSSMVVWIERGKVPSVRLERDGRRLILKPCNECEADD